MLMFGPYGSCCDHSTGQWRLTGAVVADTDTIDIAADPACPSSAVVNVTTYASASNTSASPEVERAKKRRSFEDQDRKDWKQG